MSDDRVLMTSFLHAPGHFCMCQVTIQPGACKKKSKNSIWNEECLEK